jgi:hypothetical protein
MAQKLKEDFGSYSTILYHDSHGYITKSLPAFWPLHFWGSPGVNSGAGYSNFCFVLEPATFAEGVPGLSKLRYHDALNGPCTETERRELRMLGMTSKEIWNRANLKKHGTHYSTGTSTLATAHQSWLDSIYRQYRMNIELHTAISNRLAAQSIPILSHHILLTMTSRLTMKSWPRYGDWKTAEPRGPPGFERNT